tara:strand:- start:41886 stop:43406 length:1521 start_codon:yes stop_codon:yes gene_type:complete
MNNHALVIKVLEKLASLGLSEICILPGSRNAPIIEVLKQSTGFDIKVMHEEREAAFYAYKRSHAGKRLCAIVTTSGSAVAEAYPAVIEAYYQNCPFVIISADRPKSYRGSGSPQSIEQAHLFAKYADSFDLDDASQIESMQMGMDKAIHINLCFDEPLKSPLTEKLYFQPANYQSEKHFDSKTISLDCQFPLVLVSELESETEKQQALRFLQNHHVPHIVEALSGLGSSQTNPYRLFGPERLIYRFMDEGRFDAVLRIGKVPVSSIWRRLEKKYAHIPVYNFTKYPFAGLARQSQSYNSLNIEMPKIEGQKEVLQRITQHKENCLQILEKYPLSEPAMHWHLSKIMPANSLLYLGNSLPIRYWQHFQSGSQSYSLQANRGANGIDGQVASFIACAAANQINIALLGDQTMMYSESALHFLETDKNYQILCMNNRGGQIFSRMYEGNYYINSHNKSFAHLAAYHDLNYKKISDARELTWQDTSCFFELQPCLKQSHDFWKEYESLKF